MRLKVNGIINAVISYCSAHVMFQGRRHLAPAHCGWSAGLASPTIFEENNYPLILAVSIAARIAVHRVDSSWCPPLQRVKRYTVTHPQKTYFRVSSRFVCCPSRRTLAHVTAPFSIYAVPTLALTAFVHHASILANDSFQIIFFSSPVLKSFASEKPRAQFYPCRSWERSARYWTLKHVTEIWWL